ncbi:Rieske (2Fe-2S) protein [Streptomyces sp. NPDC005925]|uniref:Rieske (2Fe-2S) protein n=1 Tax=Streptomyces sp. NPDC005925 TaxID=3157172 RepID=UPI0033F98C8A
MPGRPSPSRRTVLRGAALTPVAGTALAACGPGDDEGALPTTPTAPVELGAPEEIAEGSPVLYREQHVVVSRAGDGSLKAYSAVCTHGGCAIGTLEGKKLVCVCHGSEFDATTGEVLHSPARRPLVALDVREENGRVVAGPKH